MARKPEIQIIRPRKMAEAMSAFNDDVNFLASAVRNSVSFLNDDSLDPDKTRKVVAQQLDEAHKRVWRWYEAD